ncbi:MAG: glycerate kinase [Actinobacteria bacterium]|nr:glycerate kinase [Actinomycetota bacterium]
MTPSRIVLAPNAFKGTLTAEGAAAAMAAGVRDALPSAEVLLRPLADGGDGSLDALVSAGFTRHPVTTSGPTGEPVESSFAIRNRVAVVELADSCGLARLPAGRPEPMTSSTAGLGDAISAALDSGVDELVICVGGSASTDGGAGLLTSLGAVLRDARGEAVRPGGGSLGSIVDIDLSGLDPRLAGVRIVVATDVTSPLLGPTGAAAVFAPQKGADAAQVEQLEAGLTSWSQELARVTGREARMVPGSGAAGGTAFAAITTLEARVVSGAQFIASAIGLADAIADADLVITGEGALDLQGTLGKGTGFVARLAAERGVPCIAVCGRVDLDEAELAQMGIAFAIGLNEANAHDPTASLRSATADALRAWTMPSEP